MLCTFNKKRKKNSNDLQSPHKGGLFYLCVLLSASEMSHTSENWHCDFQFVREAGWFHIPTETGCLPLSFMKYKSQIKAWRLRCCRAHAEIPPRSCWTEQETHTEESTRAQRILTHTKKIQFTYYFVRYRFSPNQYERVPLPATRPELPSWLGVSVDELQQRVALMTQLITSWHGAIVHITDN